MPCYAWAPAWVRWRVSADHVGWVPLSPKAKWNGEKGITGSNYKYKNADNEWVFVLKENFVNDLGSSNIIPSVRNSEFISKSESITDIKVEDDLVVNRGPDAGDIEKRTGKKLGKRYLKFTKERGKFNLRENEVVISREDFKKYNANIKNVDRPKNFKKSDRVKKLKKKNIQRKKNRLRVPLRK